VPRARAAELWAALKAEDRKNMMAATKVWTCSRFAADWIREIYGREAEVVYQGIRRDFLFSHPLVKKEGFLLSVGRLEERKGFRFILEVLSRIPHPSRPELKIVYDAAEAAEKEKLMQLAHSLDVRVEWIYRPRQNELRDLYCKASLVLCAGYEEPFGLTPIEGMACGTPIIAVNEGGYRESVQDRKTGRLLKRDAGLWASEIEDLLKDDKTLTIWRMEAAETARSRWTWREFVDKLNQLSGLKGIKADAQHQTS
jgi:glycosyltransferase involved in cell wall biosynthesis